MVGTHSRVLKRAIPAGLIGMIVMVAAIEAGLRHRVEFTNGEADQWSMKARVASGMARMSSVLCFGDSLVEFAVLPKVIEGRTHRPAFNLALPAGTPAASYFLLKKSLDSGARPRAIVVDFLPLQLV